MKRPSPSPPRRPVVCASAVGAVLLLHSGLACAATTTYQFDSIVDATSIGLGRHALISFRYEFDKATTDRYGNTQLGLYELTALTITLDGRSASLVNPVYPQGVIFVSDDAQLDGYGVQALNGRPVFSAAINGHIIRSGGFGLSSLSATSWDSDSLIASIDVLNGQRYSSVYLRFDDAEVSRQGPHGFGDDFTPYKVSAVSSVPEPASLALCFVGILASLLAQTGFRRQTHSMKAI